MHVTNYLTVIYKGKFIKKQTVIIIVCMCIICMCFYFSFSVSMCVRVCMHVSHVHVWRSEGNFHLYVSYGGIKLRSCSARGAFTS